MKQLVHYLLDHDIFRAFKTMHKRDILKHFVLWLFGILLLPLGGVLVKHSAFGAGGGEILNFALRDLLRVDIAIAVYITAAVYVSIATIVRKGRFNWPTIVTFLLVGACTSFWERILVNVDGTGKSVWLVQFPLFVVSILILAIGAGLMISTVFPANAMEDLVESFNREKGIPIWVVKTVADGICVLVGFCLSAFVSRVENNINIGTLIITFCLGPLFGLSQRIVCKMFKIEYETKK